MVSVELSDSGFRIHGYMGSGRFRFCFPYSSLGLCLGVSAAYCVGQEMFRDQSGLGLGLLLGLLIDEGPWGVTIKLVSTPLLTFCASKLCELPSPHFVRAFYPRTFSSKLPARQ